MRVFIDPKLRTYSVAALKRIQKTYTVIRRYSQVDLCSILKDKQYEMVNKRADFAKYEQKVASI